MSIRAIIKSGVLAITKDIIHAITGDKMEIDRLRIAIVRLEHTVNNSIDDEAIIPGVFEQKNYVLIKKNGTPYWISMSISDNRIMYGESDSLAAEVRRLRGQWAEEEE